MQKITELKFKSVGQDDKLLEGDDLNDCLRQLDSWEDADYGGSTSLYKAYKLKDFKTAQKLAVVVGNLAEKYKHHPILSYTWGKLEVYWFTHSIKGVHINDVFMASETDKEIKKSKLLDK